MAPTNPDNVRTPFGFFLRSSVRLSTVLNLGPTHAQTQIPGGNPPNSLAFPADVEPRYVPVVQAQFGGSGPIFAPNNSAQAFASILLNQNANIAGARFTFTVPQQPTPVSPWTPASDPNPDLTASPPSAAPPPEQAIFIYMGIACAQLPVAQEHGLNGAVETEMAGPAFYWVLQWGRAATGGGQFWTLAPWMFRPPSAKSPAVFWGSQVGEPASDTSTTAIPGTQQGVAIVLGTPGAPMIAPSTPFFVSTGGQLSDTPFFWSPEAIPTSFTEPTALLIGLANYGVQGPANYPPQQLSIQVELLPALSYNPANLTNFSAAPTTGWHVTVSETDFGETITSSRTAGTGSGPQFFLNLRF